MKRSIYIEGNSEAAASLLLHFAILLSQHRLRPESLVWNVTDSNNDVRLLLRLDGEEPLLNAFAEECRNQMGVQYLGQATVDDGSPLAARLQEFAAQSLFDRPSLRRTQAHMGELEKPLVVD
jgi:hypothetical protein